MPLKERKKLLETKRKTPEVHIQLYRPHLCLLHHLDIPQLPLPLDNVGPFLVGRYGVDAFSLPARYALSSLSDLAPNDLVLLAHLALGCDSGSFEDQLHAACLAGSVLLVAMGAEASPLVVAAGEDLLVVETHLVSGWRMWRMFGAD
jgi:hypothetical protein